MLVAVVEDLLATSTVVGRSSCSRATSGRRRATSGRVKMLPLRSVERLRRKCTSARAKCTPNIRNALKLIRPKYFGADTIGKFID